MPIAVMGDKVISKGPGDTHVVMVPSPSGSVPTPTPGHVFNGMLDTGLSTTVFCGGKPIALKGSQATNLPPHIPIGGPSFQSPPKNTGTVIKGSGTVLVQGKGVARSMDPVETCDDILVKNTNAQVQASSQVYAGE